MNKSFLFPEQISEILTKNIKNKNAVFIFPTDTVLNSWSDFLILHSEKTSIEAVCMESFLAWDKFKAKYLHAVKDGFDTIPSVLKKFFVHNLILENSKKPIEKRFQVIINPNDEYASHAFSFADWIYKNLSSLDLLQKRYVQNPDYIKDKEDYDYLKLYNEYKDFLEKNKLYEPSWVENINFNANGKTFFLFYPELLEDFSDFSEILEKSPDFNVFLLPKETENPPACFYSDSRAELRYTILKIIQIVNEGNADWSEIALSVPNIETYRPYLEREFSLYDIPFVIKAGVSLTKNNAAKIFKEIFECYNANYSYEKVRSLILDENVPWKDEHKKNREALVRLGNKMRTVCSVDNKNIWFVAFNQKIKELEKIIEQKKTDPNCLCNFDFDDLKNELSDIYDAKNFFGKLKHFTDAFFVENANFSTLLTCWQAFKSFFLKTDENFSNDANNILGRAICELKEIIQIEQKYAACNLKIQNPFSFFITELESKKYTPQQKNKTGICVFPYRLSALCYFKYQFVIDASQKNLEIPYKKLSFLNAAKREKLHLTKDDKQVCASDVFIKLYAKQTQTNKKENSAILNHVVFSAAENTFFGFAIPHSSLKIIRNSEIEEQNFLFDKNDYILNEKKFLLNQNNQNDRQKVELFLTQKQKEQFFEWSEQNFYDFDEKSHSSYKINQKMQEKINQVLKENRIGTDILTDSQTKTQNIKITARADLENFFPCPRKWLLKSILKLHDDTLDTQLMQPYDMGNLNHKILELFMSSFENKILPFFDETSQSFKILQKDGIINSSPLDYNLNLMPFIEKSIIMTQNIKDAPLAVQSLTAQKENIEKDITDFLKVLLLPFGEKPNCKKGYEKLNGIGNCTVFACEKAFTAVSNIQNNNNCNSDAVLQYFGKIDTLLISPQNDWIVIDYKNTKIPKEIQVNNEGILQDFQMPVYFKILHEEKKHNIAAGIFYSIKEKEAKSAVDIFAKKKNGDSKNASYEQNKTFDDFNETMNSLDIYAATFEKMIDSQKNHNEKYEKTDFSPHCSNSKNDILNVNVYKNCRECTFKNICRTTYVIGKKSVKEKGGEY